MNPALSTASAAPDPAAIHRAVAEALAHPDYHLDEVPNRFASVMDWLKHALGWVLDKILGPISLAVKGLFAVSPVLGWCLIGLLTLILFALFLHIGVSIGRAIRVRRGAFAALDTLAEPAPADWESQACQAAARGDYISAVRALFHAVLLRLQATLRQPLRRGATNREVLLRFRDTPAYTPLLQFIETLDLKWYGGNECVESDYRLCAQAHERLCEAARELGHAQSA